MKKYRKNLILALVCFLIVIVLNFFLPRLLPGNPIAYLTGFSEEDMTPAQAAYYRQALHLDEPVFAQFGNYLRSLFDGTLGCSYKKETTVSALIGQRLGYTLQITLPAVVLSTALGLLWGLHCGYKKGSVLDKLSTTFQIVINTMPTFLIALVLMILFCFRQRWFPYTGLNSAGVAPGTAAYLLDRIHHLILPVLTLTIAAAPSRCLLMRNTVSQVTEEKYVLYLMEQKDIVSKRAETSKLKTAIESGKRRIQDLDKLIERIYEDQVLGNISAERYARMSVNYENGQRTLINKVAKGEKRLACIEQTSLDLKTLSKVLRSSTSFEELTPTLVNSLIRRIEVHNNDKSSGHCYVKVDICFTAIGLIDIPTEDEIKSLMAKIKANPQEYRLTA